MKFTRSKALLVLFVAVLSLFANPHDAFAKFAGETVCNARLVFPNDDGSSETYDLVLEFDGGAYSIRSTNTRNGEVTVDTGNCGAYLGRGCRHRISENGEETGDYYTFVMQKVSASSFAYQEAWADGSSGSTVLTCRAKP